MAVKNQKMDAKRIIIIGAITKNCCQVAAVNPPINQNITFARSCALNIRINELRALKSALRATPARSRVSTEVLFLIRDIL